MNKALIVFLVLSLISLSIPIFPIDAENKKAVINVDLLNVRSGPGLSYDVIASVKKGEQFEILSTESDWTKIKLTDNKEGWIAGWFVSQVDLHSNEKKSTSTTKYESKVDNLRIRKGPGLNFPIVGFINKGNQPTFIEKNEEWVKITFNAVEGWVHADFLNAIPDPNKQVTDSVIQPVRGVVKASVLNVRAKASLDATIIEKLKEGDIINIISENSEWVEIAIKGQKGWVHRTFIQVTEDNKTEPLQQETKNEVNQNQPEKIVVEKKVLATVTATILNVRDNYTLSGKVISQVKKDEKLEVIEDKNNWCKILLPNGEVGWVAGWYLNKVSASTSTSNDTRQSTEQSYVNILYDTTNIRSGPSTGHDVIHRANHGDSFQIIEKTGDWYKISLSNDKVGYVAGWIVITKGDIQKVEKPGLNQYLSGKTIVIDPGHGGRDSGAKGVNGTIEKNITLRTAKLLNEKLRAAGANPVLTRSQDVYVSLSNRVSFAHYYQADAFLSLHYDSSEYPSAKGATVYYYGKKKDLVLGNTINTELKKQTNLSNRGVVYANYHVLRENKRPSILLELGFLSNTSEELHIVTSKYQEQATTAIFNGLAHYFKD